MFNAKRLIFLFLVAFIYPAPPADAQIDSRLAIGGSITTRVASSSDANGTVNLGFEMRIGHEQRGWGPQVSLFSWFDTGVQDRTLAQVDLGPLRVRPLMAGYGYTLVRGRATITADLLGGYALNSFDLEPEAYADYLHRWGVTRVDAEATNAFALKPEVHLWYDLNTRFGLKLDGGYLVARPSVSVISATREDVRHIRADTFLITIGLVYSLF
jgi:hypothetical protein